jgi:class 3 adenylate cyclase
MLLATSLASMLLTGYLAYTSGRDAITKTVNNQLVGIRTAKASEIEAYFDAVQQHILTLSESSMTIDALKGFTPAMQEMNSKPLTAPQSQQLTEYYENDFLPALSKNVEGKLSSFSYIPSEVAGQALQYRYTVNNPNSFAEKLKLDSARDGSEYDRLHQIYHPLFRQIAERMGYQDIMLFDLQGNNIYGVAKQPDFATNFKTGPYSQSNLAEAFLASLRSSDPNFVTSIDFKRYHANLGLPTSFITTTVFDKNGRFIGVLVAQIEPARIYKIMTSNQSWENVGLGKTGETVLVGQDFKLRSPTRGFLENPEEYYGFLQKGGNLSEKEISIIRNAKSPTGIVEVPKDESVVQSLAGQTGQTTFKNDRGDGILAAYQPVKLGNFRWGLIARINQDEAYLGISVLNKRLLVATALLTGIITLLSNYLARLFSSPIRKINSGLQRVAEGNSEVRVNLKSKDEIGDLANSFNDMVDSIHQKDEAIKAHIAENDRLLLNILPPSVAEQMKAGKKDNIADSFPDVSVLYAELEGFSEFSSNLSVEVGSRLLNELIDSFDELAEQFGVEKIKTIGASYLAVCGLSIPRIDHAKRAVDFSIAMIKAVQKYNRTNKSDLSLDIGIHSGQVTAGVVGKTKFIYELWGETITIASAIHESPDINIIQVTEEVFEALTGMYNFVPSTGVAIKGKGTIPVWALKPLDSIGLSSELSSSKPTTVEH